MKCPVCGINHRVIDKAVVCKSQIDNELVHYIILTHNMPGGMTEENLLQYKHIKDLTHFREVKQKTKEMEEYLTKFKEGMKTQRKEKD